jgi:hypothetical protein
LNYDHYTSTQQLIDARMGLLFNKPEGTPGSATPAIIVGAFVAFGGVLFGYARELRDIRYFPLTLDQAMTPVPLEAFLP